MPRKTRGRRTTGKKTARRGRPKGSTTKKRAAVTSSEGGRLVADMRAYHDDLAAKYGQIQEEMAAISSAIDTMAGIARGVTARSATVRRGVTSGATRGPRPAGGSLKEVIGKVLGSSRSPMRLLDISQGVVRAGYKTNSKNLSNQVSMALADMTKKRKIRKVSRGLYQS